MFCHNGKVTKIDYTTMTATDNFILIPAIIPLSTNSGNLPTASNLFIVNYLRIDCSPRMHTNTKKNTNLIAATIVALQ